MAARTYRVSIDAIPLQSQREVWQEALAGLMLDCHVSATAPFHTGELFAKSSNTGAQLTLLRSTPQEILCAGVPDVRAAAPVAIVFHCYGRGSIRSGQRACEFADGDVSVCDLQAAWTMMLREDFEILLLELPRERLLGRLGHNRLRLPVVLGATIAAAAARPVMRTLAGNFAALEKADLATAEVALTELVAGALLGESQPDTEAITQVQAGHLRRIDAAVEAQLRNPDVTIADIARQEGLSERYLQRLFERQDTTFSAYLRERRLERCCGDLIDPKYADQSIAAIGYRWGFSDQAHFSRMFSATYGTSPRDFRKAVPRDPEAERTRGRPRRRGAGVVLRLAPDPDTKEESALRDASDGAQALRETQAEAPAPSHYLAVSKETAHWGYLSRTIPPVMRVQPGSMVTIETLTQHAFDDHERMIKGDPGAESVFHWTAERKSVERRGAGPMNASIFGRGAGEGFGVHICTGPVHVCGAEPGDVLEVQIVDIRPRPCANPAFAGKSFGSNAAAWWGFQYNDLIDPPAKRETITIFETDLDAEWARAVYSYRWTPQVDPYGVRHDTMDYPGVPVDHGSVDERFGVLANVRIPARLHFGFMAVAPRESELVDSIPPGYFGGNIDNWRAGKGTTLYLPVAVPGALFSVGDPHFAQGDGEINGTALEFSLTGQFRLVLHKKDASAKPFLEGLTHPLLETPEEWILHGFSYSNYLRELGRHAQSDIYKKSSVDLALRNAFRATRKFLIEQYRLSEDEAVALISLGVDFGITQVADGNWGVHAIVRKKMFE